MLGRGVDQILPHPGKPQLRERYMRDATGYVRLAERVNGRIPLPVDWRWPWGEALAVLENTATDVCLINLETTITADGEFADRKPVCYRMHPDNVPALTALRPHVCALANNHILDFGYQGLTDTVAALAGAGIQSVGAGADLLAARRSALVTVGHERRVIVGSVAAESSGVPESWAAARVVAAARGRPVVDFGARRAHGTDAACKVARTSYLAGAAGTSNLLAARQYGIPTFGTMAHSFVQAFDSEVAAFEAFARLYPATMLLVDTYDTLRGVDHVIELAKRLGNRFDVRAVRLDSGDLDELSKATRARLDTAGLEQVEIFASSGLDENRIAALLAARCPIDGFGVGTQLVVAQDAPALDMAYKLVAYDGSGRTKFSSGKVIYPGRKQVFRKLEHGVFCGDTLGEHGENLPGDPLLVPIMTNGRRIRQHAPTLDGARDWARQQIDALPPELRSLEDTGYSYPVAVSDRIVGELARLRHADTAEAHPGSNVVGAKAKRP